MYTVPGVHNHFLPVTPVLAKTDLSGQIRSDHLGGLGETLWLGSANLAFCQIDLFRFPKDHEELEEEVDDVQVEVEGSKDVLLRAETVLLASSHHQLGVQHYVEGEDNGASSSIANTAPSGGGGGDGLK